MPLWTLKSFTAPDGKTTLVSEWLDAQDEDVQAAFLTRMKFLRGRPENGWDRPQVGQLRRGECKGLYEIVLKVNGVQHRPLGYYSGKMEFTFVAFATERDGKLVPDGICDTAKQRIKIIEEKKERVREFKIYG
jgi:hypothetical protein